MSVGLDIGTKTIKVVELEKNGDKFSLKSAGVIGYNGASVEAFQDEKEMLALADIIRKLFVDAKIESKDVAISLPESQVFTRSIRFPLLSDQEIASAVKWEAEQYIPIPLNEAIIQHQILEKRERATPPEVIVLLVAAPRTLIEKYVKVVNLAKMEVVGVETELLSISRSLAPQNQVSIILDFGARSADLAIVSNGNLIFSRSIATAGEAFTRAIAQALGVNLAQAEEYKRTYGLSTGQLEGKVATSLEAVFRVVAEEIKKAIHFYQTEEKGEPPTSLILSGGTAGMPETSTKLAQLIGLEVVIGNPFAKISLDEASLKNLAPYAPLYSIAVGLAMR